MWDGFSKYGSSTLFIGSFVKYIELPAQFSDNNSIIHKKVHAESLIKTNYLGSRLTRTLCYVEVVITYVCVYVCHNAQITLLRYGNYPTT